MTITPDQPPLPHDIGHILEHMRSRWVWFAAFGALSMFCGLVSLVATGLATIASVYLIALAIILIGGVEVTLAFNAHHPLGPRALVGVLGLLYIVAGSFALANPEASAVGFTLMLGAALLATGIVRVYFATQLPAGPKWHLGLAGAITILLGTMILAGWPANSAYVLGIFLGVDMVMYGAGWLNFAVFLRNKAPHVH